MDGGTPRTAVKASLTFTMAEFEPFDKLSRRMKERVSKGGEKSLVVESSTARRVENVAQVSTTDFESIFTSSQETSYEAAYEMTQRSRVFTSTTFESASSSQQQVSSQMTTDDRLDSATVSSIAALEDTMEKLMAESNFDMPDFTPDEPAKQLSIGGATAEKSETSSYSVSHQVASTKTNTSSHWEMMTTGMDVKQENRFTEKFMPPPPPTLQPRELGNIKKSTFNTTTSFDRQEEMISVEKSEKKFKEFTVTSSTEAGLSLKNSENELEALLEQFQNEFDLLEPTSLSDDEAPVEISGPVEDAGIPADNEIWRESPLHSIETKMEGTSIGERTLEVSPALEDSTDILEFLKGTSTADFWSVTSPVEKENTAETLPIPNITTTEESNTDNSWTETWVTSSIHKEKTTEDLPVPNTTTDESNTDNSWTETWVTSSIHKEKTTEDLPKPNTAAVESNTFVELLEGSSTDNFWSTTNTVRTETTVTSSFEREETTKSLRDYHQAEVMSQKPTFSEKAEEREKNKMDFPTEKSDILVSSVRLLNINLEVDLEDKVQTAPPIERTSTQVEFTDDLMTEQTIVVKTDIVEPAVETTETVEPVVEKIKTTESMIKETENAEYIVEKTETTKSIVEKTETTVESFVEKAEIAESTLEKTEDVESIVEKTENAESIVVETEVAESMVEKTENAESIVEKTETMQKVHSPTRTKPELSPQKAGLRFHPYREDNRPAARQTGQSVELPATTRASLEGIEAASAIQVDSQFTLTAPVLINERDGDELDDESHEVLSDQTETETQTTVQEIKPLMLSEKKLQAPPPDEVDQIVETHQVMHNEDPSLLAAGTPQTPHELDGQETEMTYESIFENELEGAETLMCEMIDDDPLELPHQNEPMTPAKPADRDIERLSEVMTENIMTETFSERIFIQPSELLPQTSPSELESQVGDTMDGWIEEKSSELPAQPSCLPPHLDNQVNEIMLERIEEEPAEVNLRNTSMTSPTSAGRVIETLSEEMAENIVTDTLSERIFEQPSGLHAETLQREYELSDQVIETQSKMKETHKVTVTTLERIDEKPSELSNDNPETQSRMQFTIVGPSSLTGLEETNTTSESSDEEIQLLSEDLDPEIQLVNEKAKTFLDLQVKKKTETSYFTNGEVETNLESTYRNAEPTLELISEENETTLELNDKNAGTTLELIMEEAETTLDLVSRNVDTALDFNIINDKDTITSVNENVKTTVNGNNLEAETTMTPFNKNAETTLDFNEEAETTMALVNKNAETTLDFNEEAETTMALVNKNAETTLDFNEEAETTMALVNKNAETTLDFNEEAETTMALVNKNAETTLDFNEEAETTMALVNKNAETTLDFNEEAETTMALVNKNAETTLDSNEYAETTIAVVNNDTKTLDFLNVDADTTMDLVYKNAENILDSNEETETIISLVNNNVETFNNLEAETTMAIVNKNAEKMFDNNCQEAETTMDLVNRNAETSYDFSCAETTITIVNRNVKTLDFSNLEADNTVVIVNKNAEKMLDSKYEEAETTMELVNKNTETSNNTNESAQSITTEVITEKIETSWEYEKTVTSTETSFVQTNTHVDFGEKKYEPPSLFSYEKIETSGEENRIVYRKESDIEKLLEEEGVWLADMSAEERDTIPVTATPDSPSLEKSDSGSPSARPGQEMKPSAHGQCEKNKTEIELSRQESLSERSSETLDMEGRQVLGSAPGQHEESKDDGEAGGAPLNEDDKEKEKEEERDRDDVEKDEEKKEEEKKEEKDEKEEEEKEEKEEEKEEKKEEEEEKKEEDTEEKNEMEVLIERAWGEMAEGSDSDGGVGVQHDIDILSAAVDLQLDGNIGE